MLSSCTRSFCMSFSGGQGTVLFFSPTMFYFGEIRVRFFSWSSSATKVLPQYRLSFLYWVCFRCFRISAPWNQFKTQKIVNKLYFFIICFKHAYHQPDGMRVGRTLVGYQGFALDARISPRYLGTLGRGPQNPKTPVRWN